MEKINAEMKQSMIIENLVKKYQIGVCYAIELNKNLHGRNIINRADLPNKEGYKFLAVLNNGKIVKDAVIKNATGLHSTTHFSSIIGFIKL